MRALAASALLLAVFLAGCTLPDDLPLGGSGDEVDSPIQSMADACTMGICEPTEPDMEEVDLQPNAMPVLGLTADQVASANGLLRTEDGWAVSLRDSENRWQVVLVDEASLAARKYILPAGQVIHERGMLLAEDTLHITSAAAGSTMGVTVHSWDLERDNVTTRQLAGVPVPAEPRGAWDQDLLLVAKKGLLGGDSAAWVLRGAELIPITTDGRVMDAEMATGLLYLVVERDGNWSVESHGIRTDHRFVLWTNDTTVGGIWANDARIAFSVIRDTSDPSGGRLHEIDHFDHSVTRLGNGWDVRFSGNTIHYLTAEEGTSSFVAEWSRSLDTYSEGVFLPDGDLWDVSEDGLWWLQVPRIDHRYTEVPNPTPFQTMLFESAR